MQSIRQSFSGPNPLRNPEIKKACEPCWKKEQMGLTSKRQREIAKGKSDDDEGHFEAKMIGNACNLKCLTCGPASSSSIAIEMGVQDQYEKYHQLPDFFWESLPEFIMKYKKVIFSGGEPFISPTCKKMIECIVDNGISKHVAIEFNTNGYTKADYIEKLCLQFKRVGLSISIDAYGERNDFVRRGSSWDFLNSRIFDYSMLNLKHENFAFTLVPVISALNIGYMDELEDYYQTIVKPNTSWKKSSVKDNMNFVEPDNVFSAVHLPLEIKEMYLRKMKHVPRPYYEILKSRSKTKYSVQDMINEWPAVSIDDWKKFYPEFMKYIKL